MNTNYGNPDQALSRPVAGVEAGPTTPLQPDQWWAHLAGLGAQRESTRELVHAARAVIAEREAEVASLKAQLDGYQGRTVYFCTDSQLGTAAEQMDGAEPGTILRATDTGRELVRDYQCWRERS